jgi:hypothetical protein
VLPRPLQKELGEFGISIRGESEHPGLLPSLAEFHNQDLINQSVVLVNGVRVALNLQLAE